MLFGYLLFHFRSVLAVLFNLLPVMASLAWTYGVVGWIYGSVNLLTGFLAAILGGLGIEHGIHLLGRYEALRDRGESSEAATREAFTHTGVAALISALVAALTFLSLAISEFRAFREFGVIAAIGMMPGDRGLRAGAARPAGHGQPLRLAAPRRRSSPAAARSWPAGSCARASGGRWRSGMGVWLVALLSQRPQRHLQLRLRRARGQQPCPRSSSTS